MQLDHDSQMHKSQFHYGSITTIISNENHEQIYSLNSTMVRLQLISI